MLLFCFFLCNPCLARRAQTCTSRRRPGCRSCWRRRTGRRAGWGSCACPPTAGRGLTRARTKSCSCARRLTPAALALAQAGVAALLRFHGAGARRRYELGAARGLRGGGSAAALAGRDPGRGGLRHAAANDAGWRRGGGAKADSAARGHGAARAGSGSASEYGGSHAQREREQYRQPQ